MKRQVLSLEEIKKNRKPIRNVNLEHKQNLSPLYRFAVWITSHVGTMGFFLIILFWTATWLSWNVFGPKELQFDPYPAFVFWLFISTLVVGGIPIIKAIQIVAEIINNVIYRDILLDTVNKISAGRTISDGLSGHPEFPNIVTQMVKVGEQTARLDDILMKLANFYEKEVDTKISTLTTLLEPMIMIILGLGVGLLVAGILMPIYNLASTAG